MSRYRKKKDTVGTIGLRQYLSRSAKAKSESLTTPAKENKMATKTGDNVAKPDEEKRADSDPESTSENTAVVQTNSQEDNLPKQNNNTDNSSETIEKTVTDTVEEVSDNGGISAMEQRLLLAINTGAEKTNSKIEDLKTELKAAVLANTSKLDELEVSVNFAHGEIKDIKEKTAQVEKENKRLKERLDAAEKGRKDLQHKLESHILESKDRQNDLERHSRSFSIRVKNVSDVKAGDNFRKRVASVLVAEELVESETDVGQAIKYIEHAHPIGETARGKTTIIARLYSRPVRNAILAKARRMKYEAGKIRVVEDMTKTDFQRRQAAYPLMKKAIEDGKKAVFRRGKLIMDGSEEAIPSFTPSLPAYQRKK
jgi:hypothetical protein